MGRNVAMKFFSTIYRYINLYLVNLVLFKENSGWKAVSFFSILWFVYDGISILLSRGCIELGDRFTTVPRTVCGVSAYQRVAILGAVAIVSTIMVIRRIQKE
jgi:hypothetical protein